MTGLPRAVSLDFDPGGRAISDVRAMTRRLGYRGASRDDWAQRYRTRLAATDTVLILAGALLASLVAGPAPASPTALLAGTVVAIVWLAALAALRSREKRVLGTGPAEYHRVLVASTLAFGILAVPFLVTGLEESRDLFISSMPSGLACLLAGRWLWRRWLSNRRRAGLCLSRAIVVGRRSDVEYVVEQVRAKPGAGYLIVGVAVRNGGRSVRTVAGGDIPVVSDLSTVPDAAANLRVDCVIVAGRPRGGSDYIRRLGWELERSGADLVLAARLTDVAGPRIHFRPVEGLPLMHVELPQYDGARHVFKRAFDIAVSATALLLLLPLLAMLAVLVRRDSPGPALFRQERVGRDGRTFRMVKFRSMVQNAEQELSALMPANEGAGLLFKLQDDPRVTRVGRVLRKYSLDELPQLWNVLVGDMSLVGPRPPLPREVESYESHVRRRLYIKPGLTGMWQVSGRSDLSWEQSVRLDLYYVENWSLAGDLVILWRTLQVLIRPVGAY